MRMIAAATLILIPLTAASGPNPPAANRCDPLGHVDRADTPGTVQAQRLDRLPPGNLDLAVMREVNGCPEPVTIREGYGAFGARAPAKAAPRPAPPRTQPAR